MKYCPKCRSQNEDDCRLCLSCGAALDGSDDWANTVPVDAAPHNPVPSNIQPEQNYGVYEQASNPYSGGGTYQGENPNPGTYGAPQYNQNPQYASSPYQQPGQKKSKKGRKQKKNQAASNYSP